MISKVTDNKYFDLSKELSEGYRARNAKSNPSDLNSDYTSDTLSQQSLATFKKNSKAKVTMLEWFEMLTLEQRVLAVSTIFPPKHADVLEHIRAELNECVKNGFDLERNDFHDTFYPSYNSNEEFFTYGSINSYKSLSPISMSRGYLSRHITFLDTATPEDTLSIDEELLQNAEAFFQILEKNK